MIIVWGIDQIFDPIERFRLPETKQAVGHRRSPCHENDKITIYSYNSYTAGKPVTA